LLIKNLKGSGIINSNLLDVFKSELVKGARFSDKYEFPIIAKSENIATKAIPFDKAMTASNYKQWVHFYSHDYRFERVWNNPKRYLELFKKFDGIITPDFSLYRELPLAMQIWNTYRNRCIAYWLENNGVAVIPNVRWGDERTYDFAFEGLAPGGNFAVSTNGCIQNKTDRYYFKKGLEKMVDVLKPQTIVNYSQMPDDIFGRYRDMGINIVEIENHSLTVRRAVV